MSVRIFTFFLFIAALGLRAAEPASDIEFSGVLVSPSKTVVHLTKRSTNFSSWVPVGQTFADYEITSYDPNTETIALTRYGAVTRVRLNEPKVRDAGPTALSEQQKSAVMSNLRQIAAAFDQYVKETGRTQAALTDLVGPDKYIRQLNSVAGEDYNALNLRQGAAALTVTTTSGATITYEHPQPNVNIAVTTNTVAPSPTPAPVAVQETVTPAPTPAPSLAAPPPTNSTSTATISTTAPAPAPGVPTAAPNTASSTAPAANMSGESTPQPAPAPTTR
jgi:hypothetical protein